MKRRHFLLGAAATALVNLGRQAMFAAPAPHGPLKIDAVELVELHGTYTAERGVDAQFLSFDAGGDSARFHDALTARGVPCGSDIGWLRCTRSAAQKNTSPFFASRR